MHVLEFLLGVALRHSSLGCKQDEHLGAVDRIGMGPDLAPADPGHDAVDLGNLHQPALNDQSVTRVLSGVRSKAPWSGGPRECPPGAGA